MAYHRSFEVDWNDEVCVGWFSYTPSSAHVLDVPAREATSAQQNVHDVQVKRIARFVPVKFEPDSRYILEGTRSEVSVAHDSSTGFAGSTGDSSIVNDEIVKEVAP